MGKPIEIKTIKTPDFEMEYFTFGTGKRPLVILPGSAVSSVMLSADAVAQAYAAFSEKYTVYLFDCRRGLQETHTVDTMAEDIAAAMKALGIEQADVFGCSMGGMTAQSLAARFPELVHKAVLASTLARPNDRSREVLSRFYTLAKGGDVRALNREFARRVYSSAYTEQYRDAFAAIEDNGTPEDMACFAAMMAACMSFDASDLLRNIRCPVLVIGSRGDHTLSGEASEELARELGCELYMYTDYGHAVYDEAPDYKERLLTFFGE